MSYEGVIRLSKDPAVISDYGWRKVDWLQVTKASYEEARRLNGKSFGVHMVYNKVGYFPGLRKLQRYEILRRDDELSSKRETWWFMPDVEGVAIALRELGYL